MNALPRERDALGVWLITPDTHRRFAGGYLVNTRLKTGDRTTRVGLTYGRRVEPLWVTYGSRGGNSKTADGTNSLVRPDFCRGGHVH